MKTRKILNLFVYTFIALLLVGSFYSCEEDEPVTPMSEPTDTVSDDTTDNGDNSDTTDTGGSTVTAVFTPSESQTITEGETITFKIEEDTAITNIKWTFIGGDPETSYNKEVTVTYNDFTNSPFDVKLVVESDSDADTLVKEDFVTVEEAGGGGDDQTYTDILEFDGTTKLVLHRNDENKIDYIENYKGEEEIVYVKPLDDNVIYVDNYTFTEISKIQKLNEDEDVYIFTGDFASTSKSTSNLVVDFSSGTGQFMLMSDSEIGFDSKIYEYIDVSDDYYHEKLDYTVNGNTWQGNPFDIGDSFTFEGETITKENLNDVLKSAPNGFSQSSSSYKLEQFYVNNDIIYGVFEFDYNGKKAASFALYDLSTDSKNVEFGGEMVHWSNTHSESDISYKSYFWNDNSDHGDNHTHFIDYSQNYSVTNVFKGLTSADGDYQDGFPYYYAPYFMYHVKDGGYDESGFVKLLDDNDNGNDIKIQKIIPFGQYIYVITDYNTQTITRFAVSDLKTYMSNDETYKFLDLANLTNLWNGETISTMYKVSGQWVVEGSSGTLMYINSDGSTTEPSEVGDVDEDDNYVISF